jgi:hypothetical protein
MRWIWIGLVFLGLAWAQETPQDTLAQETPQDTGGWVWGQDTSQDTEGWVWGQETPQDTSPSPSRKVRWKSNTYWEVGYNRFLGMPADLATTIRGLGSVKFNLQFMEMLRIGKLFYVGSGLGLVIREVRFEKNAVLYRDTTGFLTYTFDTLVTTQGYSAKSKFQLGYLRLPLEVGILYKRFHLAAYGYSELLIWARQKRKYSTSGESIKQIQSGNKNFGTEAFQYGVGARLGYRGIGVFANYNLSSLWNSSKGPDNVHPLQAGIYFYDSLGPKRPRRRLFYFYNS